MQLIASRTFARDNAGRKRHECDRSEAEGDNWCRPQSDENHWQSDPVVQRAHVDAAQAANDGNVVRYPRPLAAGSSHACQIPDGCESRRDRARLPLPADDEQSDERQAQSSLEQQQPNSRSREFRGDLCFAPVIASENDAEPKSTDLPQVAGVDRGFPRKRRDDPKPALEIRIPRRVSTPRARRGPASKRSSLRNRARSANARQGERPTQKQAGTSTSQCRYGALLETQHADFQ